MRTCHKRDSVVGEAYHKSRRRAVPGSSTGAHNLSRLVFDFNASDIPKMSLEQAINARKRILSKIPDFDLQQSGGPLGELLERPE